jgi:hypothetical protein
MLTELLISLKIGVQKHKVLPKSFKKLCAKLENFVRRTQTGRKRTIVHSLRIRLDKHKPWKQILHTRVQSSIRINAVQKQTVKAKSFMFNCAKQEIAWLELHFAMCESCPSPPPITKTKAIILGEAAM